jgi:dolichol-phosphate mannosyltransferase
MLVQSIQAASSQFFNPRSQEHWQKVFKFALVGATGTMLNLTIIYVLTDYILIWYIISAMIAIECSILWNFYLNTKITFNYRFLSRYDVFAAAFKYHLSSIAGLAINLLVLFILTEFLGIYYIFSELSAIILAFGVNYSISTRYVWYEN